MRCLSRGSNLFLLEIKWGTRSIKHPLSTDILQKWTSGFDESIEICCVKSMCQAKTGKWITMAGGQVAMRRITCSYTNPVAALITTATPTSTEALPPTSCWARLEISNGLGVAFYVLRRGTETAGPEEHNTEWRVVCGRVTARRSERVPLSGKYRNSMWDSISSVRGTPAHWQYEICILKLCASTKPCFLGFHIHKSINSSHRF
jgi:hypothetical protein